MSASFSPLLLKLIDSLRKLPGVGLKTAQRMAFHVLEHDRKAAYDIAQALQEAATKIQRCSVCRNLCENETCAICQSTKRQRNLLCIIESPADVVAIEQTGSYHGLYYVLGGHLSPIDGVGPIELGIDQLSHRFSQGLIDEVILATNPTMEGEATAHYISEIAREKGIKSSRIAYGVPLGSELEYIDVGTLTRALTNRANY